MFAVALVLAVAQQPIPEWTELPPGTWDAWLDSPGGRLEFVLELGIDGDDRSTALIRNAGETVEVPVVEWNPSDRTLALAVPHYDSRIDARLFGTDEPRFHGWWTKRKSASSSVRIAFHAERPRPVGSCLGDPEAPRIRDGLRGRWRTRFESDEDHAIALFDVTEVLDATGTFLTTLGDYRYLAGDIDPISKSLTLSCFDGAHAFLFKAALQPDGSLKGDFWSGDSWHETWTAVKDPNAALPDPFELTKWNSDARLDALEFPDLDGKPRKLSDPAFAGRARILQVFGSWCPNCNDEAAYLRELDERYRERGLSIVGLAFELTGDAARDAKQVKLYAERHELRFPLLLAGTSDKTDASKRLPLLDKVRAYPTTIFLHGDGRVRAVHQGFCGPATGPEHLKLREDFERMIEELLAESEAAK